MRRKHPQVKSFADVAALQAHLARLGVSIPLDEDVRPSGTLASQLKVGHRSIGNRLAILPMEGWDGTHDGRPTELVRRRWRRFGSSGAKLIWGCEAVAVAHGGRANPRQLRIGPDTIEELAALRASLVSAHELGVGDAADLVVGLQLTHSGRWARPDPDGSPRPVIGFRHPLLDERVGASDADVITDDALDELVGVFTDAAVAAGDAGFDFVDVKACHGYLVHELLAAHERPGRYGGDLAGRSRLLLSIIGEIRRRAPGLLIGVRLSAFDPGVFRRGPDGVGEPAWLPGDDPARWTFGGDGGDPASPTESDEIVRLLAEAGVSLLSVTCGSPYTSPHAQRPAYFPPTDGYQPPRDPLLEVAALLGTAARLKRAAPDLVVVGTGYSYLQEFMPNAAQAAVAGGDVDVVGYGRLVLSHHDAAARILRGEALDRLRVCRTFSDCTSAPRNGLVSGCYPLDRDYRDMPERAALARAKREAKEQG